MMQEWDVKVSRSEPLICKQCFVFGCIYLAFSNWNQKSFNKKIWKAATYWKFLCKIKKILRLQSHYVFLLFCLQILTFSISLVHLLCSFYSSMFNWSAATGRRKYCKWRQSGDMLEQCVGYCVWWSLGKYWSCFGLSTAGILHRKSVTSTIITTRCFVP